MEPEPNQRALGETRGPAPLDEGSLDRRARFQASLAEAQGPPYVSRYVPSYPRTIILNEGACTRPHARACPRPQVNQLPPRLSEPTDSVGEEGKLHGPYVDARRRLREGRTRPGREREAP